jgi:hypothetical protein
VNRTSVTPAEGFTATKTPVCSWLLDSTHAIGLVDPALLQLMVDEIDDLMLCVPTEDGLNQLYLKLVSYHNVDTVRTVVRRLQDLFASSDAPKEPEPATVGS